MDKKEVFTIVAIFLCLILIVVVVIHFQAPFQYQTSQTENQESTQGNLKTRREFIVEVTSSRGHRCGISVSDENGEEFYYIDYESPPKSDDDATVTTEHKIEAGVGDTVLVEVLCAGLDASYGSVRLIKESAFFRNTIAYESSIERVILSHTITEEDV